MHTILELVGEGTACSLDLEWDLEKTAGGYYLYTGKAQASKARQPYSVLHAKSMDR